MYHQAWSRVLIAFCITSRCLASPLEQRAQSADQSTTATAAAAVQQDNSLTNVMIHGWLQDQGPLAFEDDAIQSKVDMISSSLASYELLMTFATPVTSTGGLKSVLSSQLGAATQKAKKARAAGGQTVSLSLCIPVVSTPGQVRVAVATNAASAAQVPGTRATVATVSTAGVGFPYLSLPLTATASPTPAGPPPTPSKSQAFSTVVASGSSGSRSAGGSQTPQKGIDGLGELPGGAGSLPSSSNNVNHNNNNVGINNSGGGPSNVVISNGNNDGNNNIGINNGNNNGNNNGGSIKDSFQGDFGNSIQDRSSGISRRSRSPSLGGRESASARGGAAFASAGGVSVRVRDEAGLGASELWSRAFTGDAGGSINVDSNNGSCRYPQLNGHRLARDSTGQIVILVEDPLQGSKFSASIQDFIGDKMNNALGQAFGQSSGSGHSRRGGLGIELAVVVYGLGDIFRHGHR